MDRGFGMLAALYVNTHSKKGANKVEPWQFMPYAEEPEIDIEKAMKDWI